MISVRDAIAVLAEKFPNKRIRGVPVQIGDLITFAFVDKNAPENVTRWDDTVVGVNQTTGEISWHSVFDEDIC